MKFITTVTTTNPDKAGPPPPRLMQAIMELGMSAGPVLRDTGGMRDAGSVKVEGGQLVVDGPFAEAKEVAGGFAIYELPSHAAVVDYCRKFADLHRQYWPAWEGEIAIQELVPMGPPPA